MALKFLNKKGWHTGSLRNIENVWKAEQKHDAEQKKLEELRKQIQDERERSEYRLLQEQAGLVPRQERLEFLYDSGLAVGKGSGSSGGGSGIAFQAIEESTPSTNKINYASSAAAKHSSAPGALFEDKPHSSNDAWRKLHSDPLLLIRQREQEALARIKNNPVQMALLRKSAEVNKEGKSDNKGENQRKVRHVKAKYHEHSISKEQLASEDHRGKSGDNGSHMRSKYDHYHKEQRALDEKSIGRESQRRKKSCRGSNNRDLSPSGFSNLKAAKNYGQDTTRQNYDKLKGVMNSLEDQRDPRGDRKEKEHKISTNRKESETRSFIEARSPVRHDSHHKYTKVAPKLFEEERAAKLREKQVDAELHEEQRWKRLRKAEEDDALEARHASISGGKNFLDVAQRSVYGTEKGGSSTIEESVRRRTHYSQGRSEVVDGNAFQR